MKKYTGFTLLELLVVISIISILILIGVGSYTIISKQSRDARRIADMNNIRAALEMYRSQENTYPEPTQILNNTDYIEWPSDPVTGRSYSYVQVGTDYALCVAAELKASATTSCGTCGVTCTYKMTSRGAP